MDTPVLVSQVCVNTWYRLENLTKVMASRDGWQETVKGIHAQLDDGNKCVCESYFSKLENLSMKNRHVLIKT